MDIIDIDTIADDILSDFLLEFPFTDFCIAILIKIMSSKKRRAYIKKITNIDFDKLSYNRSIEFVHYLGGRYHYYTFMDLKERLKEWSNLLKIEQKEALNSLKMDLQKQKETYKKHIKDMSKVVIKPPNEKEKLLKPCL